MQSLTLLEMHPDGYLAWKPIISEYLNGLPQFPGDFDTWWTAAAIRTNQGLEFSRRNLVLMMANRAGGAHVGKIDNNERKILSGTDSGWTFPVEMRVVPPSIRTIAEEVRTAIRGYLDGSPPPPASGTDNL